MPDRDAASDHLDEKARTRRRAQRRHQGGNHWHVELRSSVVVCRACGARIARRLAPKSCPRCGAGAVD
jgi:rubrerythrin